jgi:hypothetical protein
MTVNLVPHDCRGVWWPVGELEIRTECASGLCTVVTLRRDGKQIDVTRAEWDELLARFGGQP